VTWKIEFERSAAREFKKLAPEAQSRIRHYLTHRVLSQEHPRKLGKPLKARLHQLWRYRVGNYRIVCQIQDADLIILVVRVADRAKVYE